jgi:hypothetical protein
MVYYTLNDRLPELCSSFINPNSQTIDKVQKPQNSKFILNIFPLDKNNGCLDTKNWSSLYSVISDHLTVGVPHCLLISGVY